MTVLTLEEIYAYWGYEDRDAFVQRSKDAGLYPRRSGRTAVMLASALQASSRGERVFIAAFDIRWSRRLVRKVKEAAVHFGLDPGLINWVGRHGIEERMSGTEACLYDDHFYPPAVRSGP